MNIIVGIVVILVGIFNLADPYHAWYLRDGWRYKDAEPSDAALLMGRISGGIAIVLGVICFFV